MSATDLAIFHEDQSGNGCPPIENVGKNGSDCVVACCQQREIGKLVKRTIAIITPSKETSENGPTAITKLVLWVAAVEMPDTSIGRIGTWSATRFCDIPSDTGGALISKGPTSEKRAQKKFHLRGVKFVPLEVSNCFAEQTGAHEEEEPCGNDEEDGEAHTRRGLVNDETDNETYEETANGSEGDSATSLTEGNSPNEDDGFETFSENGDEW